MCLTRKINLSNYFLIIMCMIRNFTTLSPLFDCSFDYNDLQFHLMGHHMKQPIDNMRAHTSVVDPGFPVGGAPSYWGGANLRCGHFLAETYAKMKELDPGAPPPPDPPMYMVKYGETIKYVIFIPAKAAACLSFYNVFCVWRV